MKKAVKKKSLKRRLPYFFGQRIPGSDSGYMPELIKPESELQRGEDGTADILRWADDGGNMLDIGDQATRSGPADDRKRETK